MAAKRKSHTAAFKAQVALAAHEGDRTVNELAGHYGVHPTLMWLELHSVMALRHDSHSGGPLHREQVRCPTVIAPTHSADRA